MSRTTDEPRPDTAPLFDAAAELVSRSYGPRERAAGVSIRTATGLTISYEVPPTWEPADTEDAGQRLRSPQCVAELLTTLVEIGRRMTRQALVEEMERRKRRWGEATVGAVLTDLMRLGVLTNSQSGPHKGYGLESWE